MNEPLISIIVSAYNSEKTIKKCIDSLLGIDYANYEIFIVDDGSTDKTRDILSEYKSRISVIESQHRGPSKCRNIAANKAKGEFLAFTDSDCIVDKNWLKELIRCFSNEKVVSAGGIQFSPEDETKFGKMVQNFFNLTGFLGGYIKNKGAKEIKRVIHNPSCNAMYRKGVFLDMGGFDENLWPGEDVDLDYRLKRKGFEFRYNNKAIVYHYRPQSLKQLSKMMFRYGVSMGILTKRYGFFRKIQLLPIVFIALSIPFILTPNLLWLVLLFYLLILMKTKDFNTTNYIVLFLLVSIFMWSAGLLRGLAR